LPAQESSGSPLATSSAAAPVSEQDEAKANSASRGSDLIRVPPPSDHVSRFRPGAFSSEKETSSAGSRGWWLGSTGIALALAICGAICIAARRYRPQDTAGLVQVVGRVGLTPRHSIFVVRAGQRSLLIGTGAQGAPTLLGELTESEQAGTRGEASRARSAQRETDGAGPLDPWSPRTMPGVDVRLEDEE
jgi:flagellar protein FliO/FliZ